MNAVSQIKRPEFNNPRSRVVIQFQELIRANTVLKDTNKKTTVRSLIFLLILKPELIRYGFLVEGTRRAFKNYG